MAQIRFRWWMVSIIIFVLLFFILIVRPLILRADCCICGTAQDPLGGFITRIIDPTSYDCCPCPPNPYSELCFHNPEHERCESNSANKKVKK